MGDTAPGQGAAMTAPGFRACLAMPPARYRDLVFDDSAGLDAQLARILGDYKCGRHQQAMKRLTQAKTGQGFDPHLKLIHQLDRMTEVTAPLLIFELLFQLTTNEALPPDTLWRYLDTIACFDPDDAICHGAVYNTLILLALRRAEPQMAERLCHLADDAYARCGSAYLRGFVHLHLAFIHSARGEMARADAATRAARGFFAPIPEAVSERAMVEITALWIAADTTGELPPLAQLMPLRDTLAAGEFWPETFTVFAALLFRAAAAQDPSHAVQLHSDLEAVLRLRGMTTVLPAMQLLREEYRRRQGEPTGPVEPPGLDEGQVLLLLPDAETLVANWGAGLADTPLVFARSLAARDLALGSQALRSGRFDAAAPRILGAARTVQDLGLGWLARRSQPILDAFCKEALARRRFVEDARRLRATLLAGEDPGAPRPAELTLAEYGIVRRLDRLTSNKHLARELGVTEAAVKFHLKNIYRKLGVHSRQAALTSAAARGWIAPPARHGVSGR